MSSAKRRYVNPPGGTSAHLVAAGERTGFTRCGKKILPSWLKATASSWESVPCRDCKRYDDSDRPPKRARVTLVRRRTRRAA